MVRLSSSTSETEGRDFTGTVALCIWEDVSTPIRLLHSNSVRDAHKVHLKQHDVICTLYRSTDALNHDGRSDVSLPIIKEVLTKLDQSVNILLMSDFDSKRHNLMNNKQRAQ